MRTSTCQCGNTLFFENHRCLRCERELGFLPRQRLLSALQPSSGDLYRALADGESYRKCDNYSRHQVCNWLVPAAENQRYCLSCRLNRVVPDLNLPNNLRLWYRVECAKRRLLYTCLALKLPVSGGRGGLAFQFLADAAVPDEFSNEATAARRVMTGHANGVITINIREADPSIREQVRESMNERYRTLLGHFRHESGHYYWFRLVAGTAVHPAMRDMFGDDARDYGQALARYYARGPVGDWQQRYISAYASAHPLEDWAETWAHYLHMVDTLETADDYAFFGAATGDAAAPRWRQRDCDELLRDWGRLSIALNATNRSMGLDDAYPFAIAPAVADKLRTVHALIGKFAATAR